MTESKNGLPHVAVVGAGFGGLACAYELSQAGYFVDVYEARNSLGGRVRTRQEFAPGQHVECGAELIGKNHPHWQRYAKQFGIGLCPVNNGQPGAPKTILIDGIRSSVAEFKAIKKEVDVARADLNRLAAGVNWDEPWKTPDAERLDQMSTADWMKLLKVSDRTKRVIALELETVMAVSLDRMNFLALLATIQGHGGEKFWEDTEVYRAKAGNQTLASHLAAGIHGGRLHLDCPVRFIHVQSTGMAIGLLGGRNLNYDEVVLAVPPSVWDKIDIIPALPKQLRPQMGLATKFLTACTKDFWHPQQSADSLTNTLIGSSWEGPRAERGERRSLVGFAGGPLAEKLHAIPLAEQVSALRGVFEEVMPGYQAAHLKSDFVDWPSDAWTRGGYSFPRPGEFVLQSRILREGIGHLHFAGEHVSCGFIGYMEGALESGVLQARRLIERNQPKK